MIEEARQDSVANKLKSFGNYIQLLEVGNQPYKWKRTQSTRQKWQAMFVTENKQKYYFEAFKVSIGWEVIFHAFSRGDDSMGITGTQKTSAVRVFSTVANILEEFVKEVSPNMFSFTADKTEKDGVGSRAKLYSRFAKVFAKKHGYRTREMDKSDEVHFVFINVDKSKKK